MSEQTAGATASASVSASAPALAQPAAQSSTAAPEQQQQQQNSTSGGAPGNRSNQRGRGRGGSSNRGGGRGRGAARGGRGGKAPRGGRQQQSAEAPAANGTDEQQSDVQQPANAQHQGEKANRGGSKSAGRGGRKPGTRGRFEGTLTSNDDPLDPTAASFTPPKTVLQPTAAKQAPQTLRERLALELSDGSYDCIICFSAVGRHAPVHSCGVCHAVFHLRCISQWAVKSSDTSLERATAAAAASSTPMPVSAGEWRCPACQSPFPREEIPKVYSCFCGRTPNPRTPRGATPHSCGQPCQRERPAGCTHPCPAGPCHPGPCGACAVIRQVPCHCAKSTRAVRCSTLSPPSISASSGSATLALATATATRDELLSCGAVCGRALACGVHTCDKSCHAGECAPCDVVRDKTCYCRAETKHVPCGEDSGSARVQCKTVGGPENEAWTGEWSCDAEHEIKYACGEHSFVKACVPNTDAARPSCPRSPELLKTCPCGASSLEDLAAPRTSCTDPISTCGRTCSKERACGHACSIPCHTGDCPPCTEPVTVLCRCGSAKTTRRCCENTAAAEPFLCERVCRAMRACGRHQCARRCCPLYFQEAASRSSQRGRQRLEDAFAAADQQVEDPEGLHECDRVCGRQLECGVHKCERRDHKAPCPPCLAASFDELVCPCGLTVVLPPVPCNFKIECSHPCRQPMACGHPQIPHLCHSLENHPCPPCPYLVKKPCACGKTEVANVRCAMESSRVSCGKPCGALLRCGFHRCRKPCHPPGECEPRCVQQCSKPRRHCSHPCAELCHAPRSCPTHTPCPTPIELVCECGRERQRVKCGSSDEQPEGARARAPLACTDACARAKRNEALASALGIENHEPSVRAVEYDPVMLAWYSDNKPWCDALEGTLTEFVRSGKPNLHLPVMRRPQRQFAHELAERFELRSESLDEEPKRSIAVYRQSNTDVPTPNLATALKLSRTQSAAGTLTFGSVKGDAAEEAEATAAAAPTATSSRIATPAEHPRHNALMLGRVFGVDNEALQEALAPALNGVVFDLRWPADDTVLVSFPGAPLGFSARLPALQRSAKAAFEGRPEMVRSVELARVDANGQVIADDDWVPVAARLGAVEIAAKTATNQPRPTRNAFAALSDDMH